MTLIISLRYFHIRRLGYDTPEDVDGADKLSDCNTYSNVCRCNGKVSKYSSIFSDASFHHKKERERCESIGKHHHHVPTNEHLKGIFNCRFSNPVQ